MKRKLILLPITLTALAPTIGMVGCDKPESQYHSVKVDSSSDTANIIIYDAEITLNKQLVISYQMMSATKELDIDNSWVKFDSSSQLPLSNPEFSHDNNKVIIPADKVTTYDIAICLKSKEKTPPEPTEYDLTIIPDEFAHVTPTKFKLNETLVINYSLDNYCSLNQESTITIGQQIYTITQLSHDDTTITLPGEIMNSSSVVVKLIGVEYWPDQFRVVNQFSLGQYSAIMISPSFPIEENTTYYFEIDMDSWTGSKSIDTYGSLGFFIKGGKDISWKKEDFKIIIDDNVVSADQYVFDHDMNGDWVRFRKDEIREKFLNAKTIIGRIHVDSFTDATNLCYFKLHTDLV